MHLIKSSSAQFNEHFSRWVKNAEKKWGEHEGTWSANLIKLAKEEKDRI